MTRPGPRILDHHRREGPKVDRPGNIRTCDGAVRATPCGHPSVCGQPLGSASGPTAVGNALLFVVQHFPPKSFADQDT